MAVIAPVRSIGITDDPSCRPLSTARAGAPIAKLDPSAAKITKSTRHGHVFGKIAGLGGTLNSTATGAINSTFGTSLPAEVPLGTATVLARVAR